MNVSLMPILGLKSHYLICSCSAVTNKAFDMIRHANYIALIQQAISRILSNDIKIVASDVFSWIIFRGN